MYHRVIPRDLFNEAKLLKCLGQLALIIHDGRDSKGQKAPPSLTIEHNDEAYPGFNIGQNPFSGDLYCSNIVVSVKGNPINLVSAYNNKRPFPLIWETEDDSDFVFNDDGTLSEWFLSKIDDWSE